MISMLLSCPDNLAFWHPGAITTSASMPHKLKTSHYVWSPWPTPKCPRHPAGPSVRGPALPISPMPSAHIVSSLGVSPAGGPGASFLTSLNFHILLSEMISNKRKKPPHRLIVRVTWNKTITIVHFLGALKCAESWPRSAHSGARWMCSNLGYATDSLTSCVGLGKLLYFSVP